MRPLPDLSAYLILDPGLCGGAHGMVATALAAAEAGVRVVQLRDKSATTAERAATASALMAALDHTGAAVIVNDDLDAALAAGAHGLHVGQNDLKAAAARAALGPGAVLGVSVETVQAAAALDPALVDYAGAGPVFATQTKADHEPPIGWDGLARIVAAAPVPCVAIGGIKAEHAKAARRAGAAGVAVVSAICGRPDPGAAARDLARASGAGGAMNSGTTSGAGIANVLSVAGSDPSGGAGIQADLKTFSARGTYGMAALTALTAQNTRGVTGIHIVPPDFVADQIAAIFADIRVDAVKIGMIAGADTARAVARALAPHRGIPVVLDPVMVAKGGARLLPDAARDALRDSLLPLATHLTPNLPEAAALLDAPIAASREQMQIQAAALAALGPAAVLLKGGHLPSRESPDVLVTEADAIWFSGPRIDTDRTHGTGCTLSAALAAELAQGRSDRDAVAAAKAYVSAAIGAADRLDVGRGHGPTHHFHALWPDPRKDAP